MASRAEKFILVYIGEEQYALPALSVGKFIEFDSLTLIPNIGPSIKGLIYNNGNIITVIDTKKILKLKTLKNSDPSMCLVFEFDGYHYGLSLDQGGETIAVNKTFNDRQKKSFKRYFRTKDKKKIYILEVDEILSQINIYD
jgi:chemotaxis signal transduction protein